MTPLSVLVVALTLSFSVQNVNGHGYMLSPINRGSIWRVNSTHPINYNDNELFCGGTYVQYEINHGNCGICGDDYRDEVPRRHENGGTFGQGVIVANYTSGSIITVTSMITANHLGSIYFHLCKLDNPDEPEIEECFKLLRLADGATHYEIDTQIGAIDARVRLPKNFTCDRCVLRWHYRTGNSWGLCEDGTANMGCGNQEIFRSCADITIVEGDGSLDDSNESNEQEGVDENDVDHSEEEEETADEEDSPLQPCLLQGILYPLNTHDPRSRSNEM